MHIQKNTIHIWSADIKISDENEQHLRQILSTDENLAANKFKFPIHRKRYIAARSILRRILSDYVQQDPEKIVFKYSEKKKPYLNSKIQFNVSHSEDLVVYAFTLEHPIGIDIEYMDADLHLDIAKRFFSKKENQLLQSLSDELRIEYFYRIWARKEALIKATGKGFTIPISTFSVNPEKKAEQLLLDNQTWEVRPLSINHNFQTAVATYPPIEEIVFFQWQSSRIY